MGVKAKKYTLYKPTGDGSAPPCAFFNSPEGCKNGDNCKFSHAPLTTATTTTTCTKTTSGSASDSSSVVSSESEDENENDVYQPPPMKMAPKASASEKKNKRKRNEVTDDDDDHLDDDDDIFASPKNKTKNQTPKSNKKKTPNASANKTSQQAETVTPKSQKKKKQKVVKTEPQQPQPSPPQQQSAIPSFRKLNLPIAEFSCYDEETQTSTVPKSGGEKKEQKKKKNEIAIPQSTPEGLKWQKSCLDSRAHKRYAAAFNFQKYKELDEEHGRATKDDWIQTKPFGPWCASNPHAIAIDCEMCETKDPVTGVNDPKALCRISVVNAVNPSEVLLDTLVKPDWPVTDHRSRINGIKDSHLSDVKFTLKHAQEFMLALCSEETVIIGHAVHNDLVALRMEHHCNVDSAFLFTVKDEPDASCSLKDLAMSVLKRDMPDTHDSVNDARVAMMCIEKGYLETDGKPEPIIRSFPKTSPGSHLLVHRIPKICKKEHIEKLFLAHTSIVPKDVPDIEFGTETGKVTVEFQSPAHANLAFRTLTGQGKPDKSGRLQKRIYMKSGGYVQVRLMRATKSQFEAAAEKREKEKKETKEN